MFYRIRYNVFMSNDERGGWGTECSFHNVPTLTEAKEEVAEAFKNKEFCYASIYDREDGSRIARTVSEDWKKVEDKKEE